MKIIHIIPSLQTGGAERLALDICLELNKRKEHQIKLIILKNINHFKIFSFIKHLNASINISLYKTNIFSIQVLQNEIEVFKPDIIHTHLFEAEIISRSIFYPKAKWFSHFHDNMFQLQNFQIETLLNKQKLTNFYEKYFLLKSYKKNGGNNFITISKDSFNYAKKVLPKKFSIYLLKNAIDFNKFHNKFHNKAENKILKLINVGSFQAKKNQQLLVYIVEILKNKGYDVELTLLGDGKLRKKVEELTKEKGLTKNVVFKGNVCNVNEYLKKSDIYIHSAFYEAFGLVLIEAMAAGLPVITQDGKGNRDIIEEGKNGYMIYEQDAVKFADTIINLWEDKNKMNEISKFANEYAKQYDIVNYVDKLLELYQKAINLK